MVRMIRAGLPPMITSSPKLRADHGAGGLITLLPRCTPGRIVAWPPIQQSLPMMTRRADSVPFAPQARIERVPGGVNADLRAQRAIVADTYFGSVENDAATVGVEVFANVNVDAIVAIELASG